MSTPTDYQVKLNSLTPKEKLCNSPEGQRALQQLRDAAELSAKAPSFLGKESAGLKYDSEKPRMDLLDADFLEGVASVLTFGADKYSEYGECNCQQIIKKSIENATESISTNGVEITQQLIQNIEKSGEGLLLKGITKYQMRNLTNCLQFSNVKFVVKRDRSILITATKLPKFVVDYVGDAILHSAVWKGKDGWELHSPTCKSLKEIKTGAHNWRGGIAYSRLVAAIYRHLGAINRGEDIDPESGLAHVHHLGCCVMFLSNMMKTRPDLDDRYKSV